MLFGLLDLILARAELLGIKPKMLRSSFSGPYGKERIELRPRRSILVDDVIELAAGEEIQGHDLQMSLIVGVQPEVDRFRWEAAIGEGQNKRRTGLEHTRHFDKRLDWARKILHRYGAERGIESVVLKW